MQNHNTAAQKLPGHCMFFILFIPFLLTMHINKRCNLCANRIAGDVYILLVFVGMKRDPKHHFAQRFTKRVRIFSHYNESKIYEFDPFSFSILTAVTLYSGA